MGMRAIAIDGGDAKRDLCLKMGAEEFVDFTKEKDVPAKIKEIADGIGAHGVLVTAYQAYNGKLGYTSSSGYTDRPADNISTRLRQVCR
jgi:propanol-preferring alcohol dehydrogenase